MPFSGGDLEKKTRLTISWFGSQCFLHMEMENSVLRTRFSSNYYIPLGEQSLRTAIPKSSDFDLVGNQKTRPSFLLMSPG